MADSPLRIAERMLAQGRSKKEVLDFLTSRGYVLHGSNRQGLKVINSRLSKEKETSLTPLPEYATFMAIRPSTGRSSFNVNEKRGFKISSTSRRFNEGSVYVFPKGYAQQYPYETAKATNGNKILLETRTKTPELKPSMEIRVKRSDLQNMVRWRPGLGIKLAVSHRLQGIGRRTRRGIR